MRTTPLARLAFSWRHAARPLRHETEWLRKAFSYEGAHIAFRPEAADAMSAHGIGIVDIVNALAMATVTFSEPEPGGAEWHAWGEDTDERCIEVRLRVDVGTMTVEVTSLSLAWE